VYVVGVGFPMAEFVRWGRCAGCVGSSIGSFFFLD
jgi:hypothetical protein